MNAIDAISAALGRVARKLVGPLAGAAIVGYFAFYAVEGDRGIYALKHLQNEVVAVKATLAEVQGERERLERRARLLRPDSIDLDMLDERVRTMLNYSKPDEIVMFYPRDGLPKQPVAGFERAPGPMPVSAR